MNAPDTAADTRAVAALTAELIERESVTPEDAGCQARMGELLEAQGFELTSLPFGDVENLWAVRRNPGQGEDEPMLVFAGHTDVVPSGPAEAWRSPPFTPTAADGLLYGRGAADMKGSLAAMIHATGAFIDRYPDHRGSIAYLITSDEEGVAVDGTVRVVDWLEEQGIRPAYCIVGEPSSSERLGDVIRIGRRGSLNGRLQVSGVQGHVAYPDQADNPIHAALAGLQALAAVHWDNGNDAFPPTSFQISNINAGTGATNVIPGSLEVLFNLRFSTEQTAPGLEQKIDALLAEHGIQDPVEWALSGNPFQTAGPDFIELVSDSIEAEQGFRPEASTGGGTSDGRFIARLGTEIVELGPVNASIHSIDEHVAIEDLGRLARIYEGILSRLLGP
ncbi:MAG: succinyl-diaminopimelate desuccinylase [Pseudomonadota bacterium]